MAAGEFEIKTADSLRLFGRHWPAGRAVRGGFRLVHGLGEHSGRYEHMAAYLNDRGYDVHAFDLRGHGRSEGKRGHAPSFDYLMDDIAAFLRQTGCGDAGMPGFLFGHSLGGNLVACYAMKRHPHVRGVILSAPALRPAFEPPAWKMSLAAIMYKLRPSCALGNELDLQALSRDPEVISKYRSDPLVHNIITPRLALDVMRSGQWAVDNAGGFPLPLLLMHGDADRLTSCGASREFALRAGERCRLKIWKGLYHEMHNEPEKEQVMGEMVSWMEEVAEENSMAIEIERKFLVKDDAWKPDAAGISCRQGYIPTTGDFIVRVRTADDRAYMAVKQRRAGMSRAEYEYSIPLSDALEMLDSLEQSGIVEKTRYKIPFGGLVWEVDVFGGENEGLVVAEVELEAEDQPVDFPGWVGREVTADPRYLNVNLSKNPYSRWRE